MAHFVLYVRVMRHFHVKLLMNIFQFCVILASESLYALLISFAYFLKCSLLTILQIIQL